MRTWTIDSIKAENAARGQHWFEPASMRFFRSRVGATVYQGPGGVYFVSSEQFEFRGQRAARLYSVRRFYPETGKIETAGGHDPGFQHFKTGQSAAKAARALAEGATETAVFGVAWYACRQRGAQGVASYIIQARDTDDLIAKRPDLEPLARYENGDAAWAAVAGA